MGNESLLRGKPVWKVIFSLAVPSVLTILIMVLYNMAGTVANIILDPVFILVLNMGVIGAAVASVIGNLAASSLLVFFIRRKSTVLTVSPKPALRKPSLFFHTAAVGLPNGVSSALSGFASTFSNQLLSACGSGVIAAMAAAGRATMVITMIQMGICMGASPLLAYNYGAKNLPRLNSGQDSGTDHRLWADGRIRLLRRTLRTDSKSRRALLIPYLFILVPSFFCITAWS